MGVKISNHSIDSTSETVWSLQQEVVGLKPLDSWAELLRTWKFEISCKRKNSNCPDKIWKAKDLCKFKEDFIWWSDNKIVDFWLLQRSGSIAVLLNQLTKNVLTMQEEQIIERYD